MSRMWSGLLCCLIAVSNAIAQEEANRNQSDGVVHTVVNEVPATIHTHEITVTGRVLDSAGKPVENAKIYITSYRAFHQLLATTVTDSQGKYAFRNLKLPIEQPKPEEKYAKDRGGFEIYGVAENYGLAWRPRKSYFPEPRRNFIPRPSPDEPTYFSKDDKIELDLKFSRSAPLRGKIVDENGNPIGDTKVHMFRCWRAPTAEFDDSDMFQVRLSSLYARQYCPESVSTVQTDENGKFSFPHAPPKCRFLLKVKPPGFAERSIYATTESNPHAVRAGKPFEHDQMQLVFQTPREVEIRVINLAEPKHGQGVRVSVWNSENGASGNTDPGGSVTLKVPAGNYALLLLPPTGTPYLATEASVPVTDEAHQVFEFTMKRAGVVIVKVVDVDNPQGKGPAGFDLWALKKHILPNGAVHEQREIHFFRSYEQATRISHVHRVKTDSEGVMQANFEPGQHRIGIGLNSRPKGWDIVPPFSQEVNLKAGEPATVTFRVRKRKAASQD